MKELYEEYVKTICRLQKRREQLAASIGENIRRVKVLDEEINDLWDNLHAIKKYL